MACKGRTDRGLLMKKDATGKPRWYDRAWHLGKAWRFGSFHTKTAAQGHEPARKLRDRLPTRMTPAQLADAQRLAGEWKPKQRVTAGQRTETPMRGATMMLAAVVVLVAAPACTDFKAGEEAIDRGDYATALKEWRALAEQGDALAQFNLGVMHAKGRGVPQDDREAVRWYRLAAAQGHARAQFGLGIMYENGRGVPQDDKQAVRWYRRAAAQGHASAQYNLGLMYAQGRGVPQDDKEAVRWYRRAAAQGHASAQNNLGLMHAQGRGVPQDDTEAVRWYGMAAQQGDAGAQNNLALMYFNGRGVPKDYVQARMWANLAAAQGNEQARKAVDLLAEKMTPAQLAEAERLAREWKLKGK